MDIIKELYNKKQYKEIVEIYKSQENIENLGEWDFIYIVNALTKLENYKEILEVYPKFHQHYPDNISLNNKVGWAAYYLYVKNFDIKNGNIDEFQKHVDFIINIAVDDQYSPKNYVILKSADILVKKNRIPEDIEFANKCLDMLQVSNLSEQEKRTQVEEKTRTLPSDKEKWYSLKTKILLMLNKYQECIEVCDEAFKTIKNWHTRNDAWFKQRKIKSLLCLGKKEDAEEILSEVLKSKIPHWIFLELAFDLAIAKKDVEQAFIRGAETALFDPSHEMRVTFYKKLADFWEKNGKTEEAKMLKDFVSAIRIVEGWDDGGKEEALNQKRQLVKKLNQIWDDMANKNKQFLHGTIIRILDSGYAGFIKDDYGNSFYFNLKDIRGKRNDIVEGVTVKFTVAERFDKKKGRNSACAVDIRIEK